MKPKLLLVSPSFPPSVNGLSNVVHAYALGLVKRGYCVEVFTAGDGGQYTIDGVNVRTFKVSGSFALGAMPKGDVIRYIKCLMGSDADILIAHAFQTVMTDLALLFFKGIKIYHSHGISWRSSISLNPARGLLRRIKYLPYEILGPLLLSRADAGIFLGEAPISDRTFDVRYFEGKLNAVVRNASSFDKGAVRVFKPGRGLNMLIVGACSREKGYSILVDLLKLLDPSRVASINICTLRSGPYLEDFIRAIGGLSSFVVNLNYDVTGLALEPYYQSSDVLLNLSLSECYPLVMADAVNSRLPIFCFDTGYQSNISGSKIFGDHREIASYINNSETIYDDLTQLSAMTSPRTWDDACDELVDFLSVVEVK